MIKRQKRAPGGGRKPQGEFERLTSLFSLRMPEDLREQVEAAAKESGRSTSQEVIRRLNDSFGINRDKTRDPATRAICFLISELANRISWLLDPKDAWHGNPFVFKAFKVGVAKLLDGIEPKGEVRSPIDAYMEEVKKENEGQPFDKIETDIYNRLAKTWKSPKSAGNEAAAETLSDLYLGIELPGGAPRAIRYFKSTFEPLLSSDDEFVRADAESQIKAIERTWYGIENVKRDLQLTEPERAEAKPKRISKSKS